MKRRQLEKTNHQDERKWFWYNAAMLKNKFKTARSFFDGTLLLGELWPQSFIFDVFDF